MVNPSTEIKVVGGMLILYPVIFFLQMCILFGAWILPEGLGMIGFLCQFMVLVFLGYWVWQRNNKARLAAIMFMAIAVAGPLLGMMLMPFLNGAFFWETLKKHGALTVVWGPLGMLLLAFLPTIVYGAFIIYRLTRPNVKAEFVK